MTARSGNSDNEKGRYQNGNDQENTGMCPQMTTRV